MKQPNMRQKATFYLQMSQKKKNELFETAHKVFSWHQVAEKLLERKNRCSSTHPSFENPSAAPGKSLPAVEMQKERSKIKTYECNKSIRWHPADASDRLTIVNP